MYDIRRLTRGRGALLATGAGAVALAVGGLTLALAPAASADGVPIAGNPTCGQQIPGSTELKVEPVVDGTYTDGTLTVTLDVRTLGADDNDAGVGRRLRKREINRWRYTLVKRTLFHVARHADDFRQL